MNKFLYVIALPVIFLLSACGPNNQLLGKWDSEPDILGGTSIVEFSRSAMSSSSKNGFINGDAEIKVKEYKVEKNKVGVVIAQGENSATLWFDIIDPNTIQQDLGMMKVRFHRKK